jgi:hypothetical protein
MNSGAGLPTLQGPWTVPCMTVTSLLQLLQWLCEFPTV